MLKEFPRPLAAVIGEVIGGYYFHHQSLESLFYEAGASGDVPAGNCVQKVTDWLVREGKRDPSKALDILGKVIEDLMDGDSTRNSHDKEADKLRVTNALARYGLSYGFNGRVFGAAVTTPSKSLGDKLRDLSIAGIEEEFDRAHRFVDSDPPGAVTAASAIVEALCKTYIQENQLPLPTKQTIKHLWVVVAKDLKLSPEDVSDDDLKRILTGLSSIVDGIGAYRTHAGSAHGHGVKTHRVAPRHARLTVHAAHTLCLFVIETWQARRKVS